MLTLKIIYNMSGEEIQTGVFHAPQERSVSIFEAEDIATLRIGFHDEKTRDQYIEQMIEQEDNIYGFGDHEERLTGVEFVLSCLGVKKRVCVIGPCECYIMNSSGSTVERIVEN